METTTKHAYWSDRQCDLMRTQNSEKGICVYLTKLNGVEKETMITEIMKYPMKTPHAERFDDSIYLGEVIRFVRLELFPMKKYTI